MENALEIALKRFLELLFLVKNEPEILWIVSPLLIVTFVMFFYFQKYRDEELGWNSAVANTLVSIFVSISLMRHIYSLTDPGQMVNFIDNLAKTIVTMFLFFWGFFLLILNFEHLLPKKIAYFISSPLSLNLLAYIFILFVYSTLPFDTITFLVLVILLALLRLILSLIQKPTRRLFSYMSRLKEAEKIDDVKKEQKNIKKEKSQINKKEKKVKEITKRKLLKEEKSIKKIKKIVAKKLKK